MERDLRARFPLPSHRRTAPGGRAPRFCKKSDTNGGGSPIRMMKAVMFRPATIANVIASPLLRQVSPCTPAMNRLLSPHSSLKFSLAVNLHLWELLSHFTIPDDQDQL